VGLDSISKKKKLEAMSSLAVHSIKRETGTGAVPGHGGIPVVATASRFTAPVHIDVGGQIYTSSLDTLTRFPDSRLSRLFSGGIPIVLDTLKQHYFIDRDGGMFRHILNFMRTGRPILPENFTHVELLLEEAKYFELPELVSYLEGLRTGASPRIGPATNGASSPPHQNHAPAKTSRKGQAGSWEVVAVNIAPEMGERIMISGSRDTLEELFPEIASTLQDARHTLAWNSSSKYVIRFPLNGYCKVTTMQVIGALLNAQFELKTSNGGGVEGQQFSEYLFLRHSLPL